MGGVRRSGRIKKEVPILLLGTDTSWRVFAEETLTVVLSRHGAGIISTQRLAPDEILTLRLLGTSKEAEVRLVGQMGQETRGYTYGLAFVNPNLDFWQMEFPPPSSWSPEIDEPLECSLCHTRELVHQSEIEADVYAIAKGSSCGTSTLWRHATGECTPRPASSQLPPCCWEIPHRYNPPLPEFLYKGSRFSGACTWLCRNHCTARTGAGSPTNGGACRTLAQGPAGPRHKPAEQRSHRRQLYGVHTPCGFRRRNRRMRQYLKRGLILPQPEDLRRGFPD